MLLSITIFGNNNYYGSETDNSIDYLSIIAIAVSILTLIITVRAIYLTKRTEIRYQKFEDLCLTPIKAELQLLLTDLNQNNGILVHSYLPDFNKKIAEFSILLTRVRRIYKNIDVNLLHNKLMDFSDFCFNQSSTTTTSEVIDEYRVLQIEVLDHVYKYSLNELKFFGKNL